jgi:hypothetical protein
MEEVPVADKKAIPKVSIMEHLHIAEFTRGQFSKLLKELDDFLRNNGFTAAEELMQ